MMRATCNGVVPAGAPRPARAVADGTAGNAPLVTGKPEEVSAP
ncbi:hypothetical protein ACIRYZ_24565 [Kitasatospora sp. NPDC101155]